MGIKAFTDQMGNTVVLPFPPKRIISLVPSQTELLADLGLDNEVKGITKFCIHPQHWRKEKTVVGGTKNFHFDRIHGLHPDLLIGNKEENYQEGIERLRQHYPVWMSDVTTPDDALAMILEVGKITKREVVAETLTTAIRKSWIGMERLPPLRVLYLIWRKPWMGAASRTFIDSMINVSGLKNCLSNHSRYSELSAEEIQSLNPDLVFLSSEPYPFREDHIHELKTILPASKIMLVDGEMFSWYGSRLRLFADYINALRSQIL